MTYDAELRHYIDKCREMSNDGEFLWWSRLANILQELSDEGGAAVTCENRMTKWLNDATVRRVVSQPAPGQVIKRS